MSQENFHCIFGICMLEKWSFYVAMWQNWFHKNYFLHIFAQKKKKKTIIVKTKVHFCNDTFSWNHFTFNTIFFFLNINFPNNISDTLCCLKNVFSMYSVSAKVNNCLDLVFFDFSNSTSSSYVFCCVACFTFLHVTSSTSLASP